MANRVQRLWRKIASNLYARVYPETHVDAVLYNNSGKTLHSKLDNIEDAIGESVADIGHLDEREANHYNELTSSISSTKSTLDTKIDNTKAELQGSINMLNTNKADKSATVSTVSYGSSKFTKTINGTTTDVVSAATLKSDMALNNVENKSSATIRGELTKANVTTALGYTPPNATSTVTNVAYGSSKFTKTVNGTTSDIVSAATLKSDMSLNNVENKSSATIRGEITGSNVTTALGYTPLNNIISVGASAPSDKRMLWIDTNSTTGGLKYHNGSSWVHVPVAYS